ncbi:MAG: hypothetical protein NTW86_27190 [Candidatus Sumerlaeota bacterium]|nr:hypothetical protein [Candidatus Sumerlaeota bacterium]
MISDDLKQSKPAKAFAEGVLRRIEQTRVYMPEDMGNAAPILLLTDSQGRSFPIYIAQEGAEAIEPWLAALRLAAAARCSLLIAEPLAEKSYIRGKTGKPLTPAGAVRKKG